jgi:hypothetical protein
MAPLEDDRHLTEARGLSTVVSEAPAPPTCKRPLYAKYIGH